MSDVIVVVDDTPILVGVVTSTVAVTVTRPAVDVTIAGTPGPPGPPGATGAPGPAGPPGPTGAGHTIQDEGAARTARTGLNFIGASVTAADDSANNRTNVTIVDRGLGRSILDYGADPTGVALCDTAFANAIAANALVNVPSGTYKISTPIILRSGVTIQGEQGNFGTSMSIIVQSTNSEIIKGTDIISGGLKDLRLGVSNAATHTKDGVQLVRSANPATNYFTIENVTVYQAGQDGFSASNLIVSTWTTAVAMQCGRHGINLYGIDGGAAGTSVVLNACYGNNCGKKQTGSGIRIRKMVYCSLNGCASEDNTGANYDFSQCMGISVNGCGVETPVVNSDGFVVRDACYGITLSGCWHWQSKAIAYDVQTGCHAIVFTGCVELEPRAPAVKSFQAAATTTVTLINPSYSTAYSIQPTTLVLNDGGGSISSGTIWANGDVSSGGSLWAAGPVTGASVNVDSTTAGNLAWRRNGGSRWVFSSTATAETAPANGTDLVLNSYDNTGAYRDTVLQVTRSSGAVGIYKPVSVTGALTASGNVTGDTVNINHATASNLAWQRNGSNRWIFSASGAESTGLLGSDLTLNTYDNTGAYASSAFKITRATGATDFLAPVSLAADPVTDPQAATKRYVDTKAKFPPFSQTGAMTVKAGTLRWYNRTGQAIQITGVLISVGTAPTGAAILVDVNINGTTIFTTQANRPSIAIAGFVSTVAVPAVTSLANGSFLTVDIDQIGSTVAGADLVVQVL